MSQEITLVYNASIYLHQSPSYWQGTASVWVNPQKQASSPDYHSDYSIEVSNWALVLDRKDPTKPPLFNDKISSNTEPPANLKALMTPANILLYMSAGNPADIPQGDLYTMLQQNGAGAELQKLERLSYYNGCGMNAPWLYTLVSVPGSGLPGIEHITSANYGTSYFSTDTTYVTTQGNIASLLSLIPGASGYTPVEIG